MDVATSRHVANPKVTLPISSVVIQPQYADVNSFSEGLAVVIKEIPKDKPVSLFIHEAAENLRFAQIGFNHPVLGWGPWQKDGTRKFDNYGKAHNYAKRREAVIRQELNISGGFAGGALQR